MGYESKIYIVEKSTIGRDINGKRMWLGDVVASFRLGKTPIYQEIHDKFSPTDTYFYADNGDTEIIEDCYGNPLTEIPIPDLIDILERAESKGHYRRYTPLIQMLQGFDLAQWKDLVALHYGY